MRDMHNNMQAKLTLAPQSVTADVACAHLDLQGCSGGELMFLFGTASLTLSGAAKWDLILEHADDDGTGSPDTWAAVTSANDVLVAANGNVAAPDGSGIIATLDADADENKLFRIGYIGPKRHARLRGDETGDTGNCLVAALGVKWPLILPAVDVAAEIDLA